MNNILFSTGGDWDTTTLSNNGQEIMAAQLFVDLKAGRDPYGEPDRGGVHNGGEMTAIVRTQADPDTPIGIFPGRLEMTFPGHQIQVENTHPTFAFEFTRIWYNGRDVTDKIMDVTVDINAVDNVVQAYITLYKPHWLGSDEVATTTIL